jgi:hypothetical protein
MPLNSGTLLAAILVTTDPSNPGFLGWPPGPDAVRERWSGVALAYFGGLVAPAVVPGTHAAAAAAMAAAMGLPLGPAALVNGLAAYAATVAAGAVPGVVATPPPAPVTLPALPPTADALAPALALATVIDAWARTGTWTTGGPPAFWS